jgi:hypothetical protein
MSFKNICGLPNCFDFFLSTSSYRISALMPTEPILIVSTDRLRLEVTYHKLGHSS